MKPGEINSSKAKNTLAEYINDVPLPPEGTYYFGVNDSKSCPPWGNDERECEIDIVEHQPEAIGVQSTTINRAVTPNHIGMWLARKWYRFCSRVGMVSDWGDIGPRWAERLHTRLWGVGKNWRKPKKMWS